MNEYTTLALDLLSVVNLLILLSPAKYMQYGGAVRRLRAFFIELVLFLLSDAVFAVACTGIGTREITLAMVTAFAAKNFYFAMNTAVIYGWSTYVVRQVFESEYSKTAYPRLYAVILSVNIFLVIGNGFVNLLFRLGDGGEFLVSTAGMVLYTVLNYFMAVSACVSVLWHKSQIRHRTYLPLLLFPLPPILGEIASLVFRKVSFAALYSVSAVLFLQMLQVNSLYVDSLTGLGNRRRLREKLRMWMQHSEKRSVSAVMVDIDDLSGVNARLGHEVGDRMLKDTAALLDSVPDDAALPIRYGGDEFMLLRRDATRLEMEADYLFIEQQNLLLNEGRPPEERIHLSMSLFTCSADDCSPDDFLQAAERSLKEKRREIDREVDRALLENRFTMYYQPIWSIREQRFIAAEALARLFATDGRLMPPEEYIAAAERSGAVRKLGLHALESTCRMLAANSCSTLKLDCVSVNLSVVQCMEENLAERMAAMLDRYGIARSNVHFEITETAMGESGEQLLRNLQDLNRNGFGLSLDDYGTGNSNLLRLTRVPLRTIKLDRSLVCAAKEPTAGTVLRNVVAMVHELNLLTVAEGVEDEETLRLVEEIGCDCVQGFYFARPLPESEFLGFIREHLEK